MKVISLKRIREASKAHSEWGASLQAWYKITKKAKWGSFQEVTQTFNSADSVGTCVVFNVGGNKCRLISYIRFSAKKLYVLHILSHAEYDEEGWKNDCDCD
jgi:mRNA interferase HigB